MSVQIDTDFWKNYATHEPLIKKCFFHLYRKKYPVFEGPTSAYNYLVMEFFRKSIFERFDAEREGKYTQTKDLSKTSQKKFEQYIYKWSESVLFSLYYTELKYRGRYHKFPSEMIEGLTESSYAEFKLSAGISSWVVEGETVETKRAYPNISEADEFRAEGAGDALDNYCVEELYSHLDAVLKDDRERKIIKARKEGLSNSIIAESLGISSSHVSMILKAIYARFSKYATA